MVSEYVRRTAILLGTGVILCVLAFTFIPSYINQQKVQNEPTVASVFAAVNRIRIQHNVAPLTESANMDKAAQLKADDMWTRHYTDHIIPGTGYALSHEMSDLDYAQCSYVSENLVTLDQNFDTTTDAIQAWVNSASHFHAIIDPSYTMTGIGISGLQVVEHFCRP